MSLLNKASLIQIPSGYKDGTLYSAKPTNGDGDFTFSRGSNLAATRVNSEGLIEKGRENLVLQSNSFDTTWSKNNVTLTSGQDGYDGSSDAWLLSKGAAAFTNLIQSVTTSGVNTFSVYAKAGTLTQLTLRDSATNIYARFNLSDGSLITTNGSPIATSIKDIGGGWYRCSITMSMSSASLQIYPDWNQTTAGSILIQDAQVEQGLVSTDVITTTTTTAQAGILEDMPRLDYSGGASCPSLLLEPQRTNIIDQSEYLSSWSTAGTTPVFTNNYGISPEGLQNSTRVQLDNSDIFYKPVNLSQGAYVFSVFAKAISGGASEIILRIDIPSTKRAVFDLSDGTIVSNNADDADIIDYGNGWYRCILIQNNDTVVNAVIEEYSDSLDCEIYGAMLEEGSYPTSYIPTYGASVTRSADDCSKTGISSLIGQTEGTMFAEFTFDSITSENRQILQLSDGSTNNLHFRIRNSNDLQAYGTGNFSPFDERLALTEGGRYKMALGYSNGDFAYYVNGVQIATDTQSTTASNLSEGYLGTNNLSSTPLGGIVQQALLFKTRLSNDELASLTTL